MAKKNSDAEAEKENAQENAPKPETKKELSVEELTDLLQRTQANFENYRKQNQAYIEDIRKMAAKDILLQLLPIIDNFELALKAIPEDTNDGFIQGIKLIHSQLLQLLLQNQVIPMETLGKDFDPYYHEALLKAPSEIPANKITEEFQKGFTMHGKVLRHAKVKVSAGPEQKGNQMGNKKENNNDNNIGGK